jgi:hypothetical protein
MNREGKEEAIQRGVKTVDRKEAVRKWERRARMED